MAYVGFGGMGAHTYHPAFEVKQGLSNNIELDIIANEMNQILQGASSDIIEELFALGGSSGGARPKIFVGYNPNSKELIHGVEVLPEGFENWIIKLLQKQCCKMYIPVYHLVTS